MRTEKQVFAESLLWLIEMASWKDLPNADRSDVVRVANELRAISESKGSVEPQSRGWAIWVWDTRDPQTRSWMWLKSVEDENVAREDADDYGKTWSVATCVRPCAAPGNRPTDPPAVELKR